MRLTEEYRWNVPVVTYGFDVSFLKYFGSNGVAAVEGAIDLLNDLPPASQIDLKNYPPNVTRINHRAQAEDLFDLKSETLFLLLQHLGLAEPQRFTFCLRDSIQTNGGFADTVIQRNFNPATFQPSSNVNDSAFTLSVWHAAGRADASEVPVDQLKNVPASVADGVFNVGEFFVGLTPDDVGGLQYLYGTNNIQFETLPPGVRGVGTTTNAFVNGAFRRGVDKVTFVRHLADTLLGQFLPMMNQFVDTCVTNGNVATQQLERTVIQPDFLFTAADVPVGVPALPLSARTDTSTWINNAGSNGNAGENGPGNIEPPVTIDLITWKSLVTNSNDGGAVTYIQWFPTGQQRFYRVIPALQGAP